MTPTSSPPLVSLQAPKDVSLAQIEAELHDIWQNYSQDEGLAATRATTFSFLVYEPDEIQTLLSANGFYSGPIDGIAGPRTTVAIKAAQKAYSLETTGQATPELSEKLKQELENNNGATNTKQALAYSPDLAGAGIADVIAASNPCRIITLCPTVYSDEAVKVQVSASCPINKQTKSTLICCEYITLSGTATALEQIGGIISELMIPELPKFVWWKGAPDPDYALFKRLISESDRLIFDSSIFQQPENSLITLAELIEKNISIADLNWARLSPWQELTAEAFDPPERRSAIWEVDRVTIDYEKGNLAQPLMFLGWIASRLEWRPVSYHHEGGDYDIIKVNFTTKEQKTIEAELAGIPLADPGTIIGDLISIRLSSTNLQADCCTVLCSETTGCMRMETGGGAQACSIRQVTSVSDQNTEKLLGMQLQRWGKDLLYEESMAVTHQILRLIA
jgi:glucose-6-phosphate dehydrogenase assembly protein OpcA